MHVVPGIKVLYFGTPVVLVSSRNEDGSANLAPMSSAWWLGQYAVIGLGAASQSAANLTRSGECVLNLPSSAMVEAVDRLAMTTGRPDVPPNKAEMGYVHVRDKFTTAGLHEQPAELVSPPRVRECPIQLECRVVDENPIAAPDMNAIAFQLSVLRTHIDDDLVIPGTHHVDPVRWDPLIMKFCEFFGGARTVHPSRLAAGWRMPHPALN
jgi:flavin reductase (DIM6/NTAB) family NADH-FMN oxidoreductase RutF